LDQTTRPKGPANPRTLAIDIGGTHLKGGVLDASGALAADPARIVTPNPATPEVVVSDLAQMVAPLGAFDRISIGFPGVVRDGSVWTAPNLGTEAWHGFPLASALADKLGKPARMENDATVQGLGVIHGKGLECVITLGTGMGFALFQDGVPAPHLELSQHPVRGKKTYDHYVGEAAMNAVGKRRWNRRVERSIGFIRTLTNCDILLIGGGNAKHITFEVPPWVRIVSNEAGITGGIRLWDAKLDRMFAAAPA
jgi:polyphosphate glucokinase